MPATSIREFQGTELAITLANASKQAISIREGSNASENLIANQRFRHRSIVRVIGQVDVIDAKATAFSVQTESILGALRINERITHAVNLPRGQQSTNLDGEARGRFLGGGIDEHARLLAGMHRSGDGSPLSERRVTHQSRHVRSAGELMRSAHDKVIQGMQAKLRVDAHAHGLTIVGVRVRFGAADGERHNVVTEQGSQTRRGRREHSAGRSVVSLEHNGGIGQKDIKLADVAMAKRIIKRLQGGLPHGQPGVGQFAQGEKRGVGTRRAIGMRRKDVVPVGGQRGRHRRGRELKVNEALIEKQAR